VDACYRRRAERAGNKADFPRDRLMTEEELNDLSEQLGDGTGAQAKRRREIEQMSAAEMEAEAEEVQKEIKRRRGKRASRLPLVLMLLCLSGQAVEGFTAYDCSNRSNIVESYSVLELDACANMGKEGEVVTTEYGEIVQIKQDRMISVFRCIVIETIISQFCGMFSAAGVARYIRFREPGTLEAWECRQARKSRKIIINGRTFQGKIGATASHSMFLAGGLDDKSNCEAGIISFPNGQTLGGQAAQALYEITLREEFTRLNELTGSLTLTSGVQVTAGDKSLVDSLEGTVVWEYDSMACLQTIVWLYRGMMKVYVNQSNTYEISMAVVEHQDKGQAVGLELAESFILCGHQAFKTHIKSIAVFIHKDDLMEGAQGQFSNREGEGDLTRLELGMSFLQGRASMSMKEKLRQVRGAICVNRREIAHTWLEAIAGADNPYSLITIFGRGHLAIKAGGAVYVTRCSPVEVLPRSHKNCTEEIPVTVNRRDAFVDPISYVIKSAGSPIHCNDVAPPQYKVRGKWYCSYPVLKECHDPAMLPVDEVRIDPITVNNIGLDKNIYTREHLEEFARFQDSPGTGKAYLAETAEMAYIGRNEKGEWGLALGSAAQGSLIDLVGVNFFPMHRVVGPMVFFLSPILLVWGGLQLVITVSLRVAIIVRYKGCGIWVLTAFWGTLFQRAVSPFNWIDTAMQDVGRKVGLMLENEASREPEAKEEDERSMEDLRRKYSWWPGSQGKGGLTAPVQGFGAEAEDIVNLSQEKSTKV
jgi:hypothetical protein